MKTEKNSSENNQNKYCGLPLIPERKLDPNIHPNRLSLIRYIEKKWVNQTVLHYAFLDSPEAWKGDESQKQVVRASFQEWKDLGIGLEFKEVTDLEEAEIRIAFEGGGSWSYVGRDAIDLVPDPTERTMNFGWDLTTSFGHDTALHEIGHALGFPHEHQNPNAGIVWDEEAVYSYFGGSPNYWNRDKAYHNVVRKISSSAIEGSLWDKDSIMHYAFPPGLIVTPETYQSQPLNPAPGLSAIDIQEVKSFYPAVNDVNVTALKPYVSELLDITPGDQMDFIIRPEISRKYMVQTFGQLDTVIVLFEDVEGNAVYLSGDDDSGQDYNASIEIRLLRGRTYHLRLRLYYSHSSGQGTILLW